MTIHEILGYLKSALDTELLLLAGTPITLSTVLVFTLILVITWVVSVVARKAISRLFRMRGVHDEGTIGVSRRLTYYLVLLVGFGIGLQTIGINLSALFAAGAVFAIGIGFAMQTMVQNFVSGVILLLEGSIKPGHVLLVDDRLVRVQRLGTRATLVRTLDDEELIVPNASIVDANVINYTLKDSLYRLRCPVGVLYSSDMVLVRRVLEDVAGRCPWRVQDREPVILLTDFADSAVVWEVSVWLDDPWMMRKYRSKLNEAIWFALLEADLVIAFPQLDVHLDAPLTDALASWKRAS